MDFDSSFLWGAMYGRGHGGIDPEANPTCGQLLLSIIILVVVVTATVYIATR